MVKSVYDEVIESRKEAAINIKKIQDEYKAEEAYAVRNKKVEEKLYQTFVKNNLGKPWFKIAHVHALKIKYDVLIITGEKNTGKTVGVMYDRFNYYYKKGKKLIFLRASKTELTASLTEYKTSKRCPFEFRTKAGEIRMYHKKTNDECGVLKDFKFCNAGSGGDFQNYAAIIYDECFPWDPRNVLNENHFLNWAAMISSVTRNKRTGIKVYCLGNLMGRNAGLLDFYGINTDDNLRYIERFEVDNPKNVCRILYVNIDNLYIGSIKNQVGAVQGMSPEAKSHLMSNRCNVNNISIIKPALWNRMLYTSAFVKIMPIGKPNILVEIRETDEVENKIYAVRAREWHAYLSVKGTVWTDSPFVFNNDYETQLVDSLEDEIEFIVESVEECCLMYYNLASQDFCTYLFDEYKKNTPSLFN